jgi:hypothetical protein
MPNKKTRPRLNYTILCDDVRQEMGGKFSLMGLFESIFSNSFPAIHPRFAIVNEWTGGRGDFRLKIRLLAVNKKEVLSESESTMSLYSEAQRHRDIAVRFNTTFAVPGTYWIQMLLDDQEVALVPLTLQMLSPKNVNVH